MKGKKSPILKAVDSDAKAAAHQPLEKDYGFRAGKVGRSKVKGARTSAILFVGKGQEAIIHVYRKTLIQSVDRIDFDLYGETQRGFVGKYRAYAEINIGMELRVRFNCDQQYPKIEDVLAEIPIGSL